MRRLRLAFALIVLGIAGCGMPALTGSPGTPSAPPMASSTVGQFRLELALQKAAWSVGEPMAGTATLSMTGPGHSLLIGAGSGLVAFDYVEVGGGQRRMLGVWTADCAPHPIAPSTPIVAPLSKGGGFDPANPSDAWQGEVMAASGIQLPAGVWDVTAKADFYEGECGGAHDFITTTVRVSVGP